MGNDTENMVDQYLEEEKKMKRYIIYVSYKSPLLVKYLNYSKLIVESQN